MKNSRKINMLKLREAIEASWDFKTSYQNVSEKGNSALGQCYPTSRVVQFFFPDTEIVEGEVWTGKRTEKHFWNLLILDGAQYHIDLSWQQFPSGSTIRNYKIRDQKTLGDSQKTIDRCDLLRQRVMDYLAANS